MTNILAIETSTTACSVAIYSQACPQSMVEEIFACIPRQHAQKVLPMVKQLMSNMGLSLSQIDAIAFARGPGSFTGLRIAAGVAQGLAYGLNIPVLPISTLAAIAYSYHQTKPSKDQDKTCALTSYILASLEARADEIYWGAYRVNNNYAELLGQELLSQLDCFKIPTNKDKAKWHAVGSGWQQYSNRESSLYPEIAHYSLQCLPRASAIATLASHDYVSGLAMAAEQVTPNYLRKDVVSKNS